MTALSGNCAFVLSGQHRIAKVGVPEQYCGADAALQKDSNPLGLQLATGKTKAHEVMSAAVKGNV